MRTRKFSHCPLRKLKTDNQQPTTDNRYGWLLAVGAAALLMVGALLPPLVDGAARVLARQAFAPVCHQLPSRSFAIGVVPLAVGHRCLGIYAGLLAGTLAWPLLAARLRSWIEQRAGALILTAGTPAALDWALGMAGLWASTALTRTATGALLGAALGLALACTAAQVGAHRGAAVAVEPTRQRSRTKP